MCQCYGGGNASNKHETNGGWLESRMLKTEIPEEVVTGNSTTLGKTEEWVAERW